jgi:two-component system, chemotaxis family, response regulator WspF
MNIAIVNDSALAVEAIRRVINSDPRHHVVWTAHDGQEAVAHCEVAQPDLILMDMFMPNVDGVEATRRIMKAHPCPILVVTASVRGNSSEIFQAMGAGALDVVATPSLDDEEGRTALLTKIERLERLTGDAAVPPKPILESTSAAASSVVLIGSSAGGPAALSELLGALPSNFPAGIVMVQHMDERFMPQLAEWLDTQSAIPVRAAKEGDRPTAGQALLAARGDHLIFRSDGTLGYTPFPETNYRPCVDRLFESALVGWTKPLLGVLLTGMGRDGSIGLKRLRDAGHFTIAQDEATSALYGMPKAAAQLHAASEILPLPRIAPRLVEKVSAPA